MDKILQCDQHCHKIDTWAGTVFEGDWADPQLFHTALDIHQYFSERPNFFESPRAHRCYVERPVVFESQKACDLFFVENVQTSCFGLNNWQKPRVEMTPFQGDEDSLHVQSGCHEALRN